MCSGQSTRLTLCSSSTQRPKSAWLRALSEYQPSSVKNSEESRPEGSASSFQNRNSAKAAASTQRSFGPRLTRAVLGSIRFAFT